MVKTQYYTGQNFGPKEGMPYTAVMPQEGFEYVYDQEGTRYSVPLNFNVSSGDGYTSLYKPDPTAEEREAGIKATSVYQGSPYSLANVPEFEGIQYSTPDYNRYQDLYRLYLGGGLDDYVEGIDPSTGTVDTSVGTGGGTTPVMGGTVPETGGDNTYIGGGATLEDAGGTYPGGYHSAEGGFEDTGTPTSDPFLASGAAGGERLPSTSPQEDFLASGAAGGANLPESTYDARLEDEFYEPTPTYADTGDPDLLDLVGGEVGGADGVGIIDEVKQPLSFDEKYEDIEDIPVEVGVVPEARPVNTIVAPDGITYDAVTGQPIYEDFDEQASATDVVTEADLADNSNLLQKLGLPADFDLKKALFDTGMNLVAGVPISLIAKGLGAILPDQDPSVTAINEFYETGEGAKYMDPNSPNYIPGMENYNTVSGNPFDPNIGLQEAYQKRLDTINKTLGKMTLEEYQNTDLVQRKKDIEEAMAKEKAMLDQLKYGDPEEIASGIGTADDDLGSEMLEEDDLMGYDEHYDMVESTTPETIASDKWNKMTDDVTLDDIADQYDAPSSPPVDEFSDEEFMVGDTSTAAPTGGDSGADSFFDAVDTKTSFDPGQGYVDTGGGGEFDTTPSKPTGPTYGPHGGGGGGNGGSSSNGGGCVIATHAVNSGAFTKDTKREAVRWCVKNLHRTWWGEAIRKGYRYYGQKAIEEGKAKNHYQEFKDYVAFGTGKRRTLKTGWTFVYRTVQFFLKGLTL